ncbi:hypothetical protein TrVE_jg6371 [Triparma verrucosa]|uniref:Uncharacterized protein n=1 Tax=Triparma verrucosa TaxID=1606542 RepID=A0A9W7BDH8_9STRA|nr:hypothetical protein TrVE_jg6371 [Triparma verrucosa]
MGCASSKPMPREIPLQAAPPPKKKLEDVEVEISVAPMVVGGNEETTVTVDSIIEGISDFDLGSIDAINPSVQDFSGSSAIRWLEETFDGTQLKISLSTPIELVARCFMNRCVQFTKGTDLGDWIKEVAQADTKKLLDGVRMLQQNFAHRLRRTHFAY